MATNDLPNVGAFSPTNGEALPATGNASAFTTPVPNLGGMGGAFEYPDVDAAAQQFRGTKPSGTQAASAPALAAQPFSYPDVDAIADALRPRPSQPTDPKIEASKPGALKRGFVSGLLEQNPEMTAEALEGLSFLAPEQLSPTLKSASDDARGLAKLSPEAFKMHGGRLSDISGLGDALTWAGEAVGQGVASSVPSLITGVTGSMIGGRVAKRPGAVVGALAGAAVPSAALNYGEVYRALKDEGVDPKDAAVYGAYAAGPMTALDTVSIGPIITRLGGLSEVKRQIARSIARRIASEAGKGVAREGVTEAAQQAVQDATTSIAADKPFWTAENMLDIGEAGVAGGLTGGVMGGVAGVRRDHIAPTERSEEATPEIVDAESEPTPSPVEQPQAAMEIPAPIPVSRPDVEAMPTEPMPTTTAPAIEPEAAQVAQSPNPNATPLYDEDNGTQIGWYDPKTGATVPLNEGPASRTSPTTIESADDLSDARARVAEPTEAQKEAGNYRKGHVKFQGLDVAIETPAGAMRSGKAADGASWQSVMPVDYGYVKRSVGADGDQVDVYLGPNPSAGTAYVIDQIDPETGKYDEHKIMLGMPNEHVARALYEAAFNDGRGADRIGAVTAMPIADFKTWLKGDTTKPVGQIAEAAQAEPQANLEEAQSPTGTAATPISADEQEAITTPAAQAELSPAKQAEIRSAIPKSTFPLRPATIAKRFGVTEPQAHKTLLKMVARGELRQAKEGRFARIPKRGPLDVVQFLASIGGVKDERGELKAMDLHRAFLPGFGKVVRSGGLSLDYAREAAQEAGYIRPSEANETTGVDDLLTAIRSNMAGDKVYAEADLPAIEQARGTKAAEESATRHREATQDAKEAAKENGLSITDEDAKEAATLSLEEGMPILDAVVEVAERTALAAEASVVEDARQEGSSDEWTIPFDGEPERRSGEEPAPPQRVSARSDASATTEPEAAREEPRADQQDQAEARRVKLAETERTEAGEQSVIPGAEKISDKELAERRTAGGKKAAREQKPADEGLFDVGGRAQTDLLDLAATKPPAATGTSQKIADFGEKIEGARKDYAQGYRDTMRDAGTIDVEAAPLSKSWPEPDYQKLIDDGVDAWTVAFVRASRDEVPPKPRKGWKLKGWVEQVTQLRDFATRLMGGDISRDKIQSAMEENGPLATVRGRISLYEAVGHEHSLKGVRVVTGRYSMLDGVKYEPPLVKWTIEKPAQATAFSNWPRVLGEGATREEAVANFKGKLAAGKIEIDRPVAKQVRFDIYRYTSGEKAGPYWIGKKAGKTRLDLKKFDTLQEARAFLGERHDELVKTLDRMKAVPEHRRESNSPRVGFDHRDGADVAPEQFAETFGFRGVQFGNWVEQTKRQQDLNEAYDALMDLAGILDIPPRSLSLNGDLGLAFGARGKGKIKGGITPAAHYEPHHIVINLTKKAGAGSLAHEWWHALDNYFSRARQDKEGYLSEKPHERGAGVRPEMVSAFSKVRTAIDSTKLKQRSLILDKSRAKAYWSSGREMSARSFESYVIEKLRDQGGNNDYLANIVSEDYWNAAASLGLEKAETYPYPEAAEVPPIRAAFDDFFQTIETRETERGTMLYSRRDDEPVVSLSGDEIGVAYTGPESMPALRRAAQSWYNQNLIGQTARMLDGRVVHFNRVGQRKSVFGKGDVLLRAIPAIRAIIENGRVVEEKPGDAAHPHVLKNITIAAPVSVAGTVHRLAVSVHETTNGDFQYNLTKDVGVQSDETDGRSPEGERYLREGTPDELNLFEIDENFNATPEAQPTEPHFVAGYQTPEGNRRRGAPNLIKRLRSEVSRRARAGRVGKPVMEIDPTEVNDVSDFIDWIGREMFADIGISIAKNGGGARGLFNASNRMVALFERAVEDGDVSETMIHELWHTLERFIARGDMQAVRTTFRRAVRKYVGERPYLRPFTSQQPDASLFLDRRVITDKAEAREYMERYPEPPSEDVVYDKKNWTVRLKNTKENYRYTNQREFFAETMLDLYQNSLDPAVVPEPGSFLGKMAAFAAGIYHRIVEAIARRLGRREMERLFSEFEAKRYDFDRRNLLDTEGGIFEGREHFSLRDDNPVGRPAWQVRPGVLDTLHGLTAPLIDRLKTATSRETVSEAVDRWRTAFQDQYLPLLRAQQAVEKQLGRALGEIENPYLGQELSSGRKGAKIEDLSENMIRPLFEDMQTRGVSVEELEAYLYARHAPERNARIAEINPAFRGDLLEEEGAGSGMTNEEAAAIMAAAKSAGKTKALEALAARIDDLNDFAMKERVGAGLMTKEEADAWRARYQHYVPLRGRADLDPAIVSDRPRTSSGVNVRGPESQRAFGRKTPARDILAHTIMQAEEAVIRAETNRVARQFYELAKAAPDPKFWKIDKVETRPVWNKARQEVEYRPSRNISAEDRDMTISLKIDGVEHRVTMDVRNPVAVRVAEAMRNLAGEQISFIARTFGQINRYLSQVNTTLNPEFVITNAFRDIQTAAINLNQYDVPKLVRGTLKDYPKALIGAVRGSFGKSDGDWGRWYKEFRAEGGRVYYNQIEDIDKLRARVDREFKNAKHGLTTMKAIRAAFDMIENLNLGVENAIRLAAYKNAREAGMSRAQAASLAKNLTVNFNKRGSYGPLMNSLYLFYNASVQGSAVILSATKSPRVRKILGATIVTGALLEMLNAMVSGEDDDGELYYDKISDYDKSRNLIVMIPGGSGEHVKIPLPYGYNVFYAIGRSAAELYRGKKFTNTASALLISIADSFNPVGGGESLLNLIAPTVVDPLVDLTRNRDYADRPIMPEQSQFGPEIPDSQRYWNSVSPFAKAIAGTLNEITGGTDVEPGKIDVSPETLEYLFGVATGAAGSFFQRNADLVGKMMDPTSEMTWNDFPFARKVIGSKPAWYDKSMFYERANEIEQVASYLKSYREQGRTEETERVQSENRGLLSLVPLAKVTRKEMSRLRKLHQRVDDDAAHGRISADERAEQIKSLEEREKNLLTRFNKAYIDRVDKGGQSSKFEAPAAMKTSQALGGLVDGLKRSDVAAVQTALRERPLSRDEIKLALKQADRPALARIMERMGEPRPQVAQMFRDLAA